MHTIVDDIIEDIPYTHVRRKRKNKLTTFIDNLNIKKMVNSHKFTKIWLDRNYYYADVFSTSLELDKLAFQQYLFVEDTKELHTKLERIGFVEHLGGYPDEAYFKEFSRMMYNEQFNIALSLYKPQHKKALYIANDIVSKSATSGQTGLSVFLSTVDVLIKQKSV